jgi:release factor glutamine methyltransferase
MATQAQTTRPLAQGPRDLTIAASLRRAAHRLAAGSEHPQLEAGLLLAHVLDTARVGLYAHPEQTLEADQVSRFEGLVERRSQGEPLPYLTKRAEFYGHPFIVDERVLIPRPETETLVELALEDLTGRQSSNPVVHTSAGSAASVRVVDVGTGSGCIAITLALRAPQAQVFAVDISPAALTVAEQNAAQHGVAGRISFLLSDLLDAVMSPVDLIIANLPYISHSEWADLPGEVQLHEPRLALDGGPDGLRVIARLLEQAKRRLRSGGSLLLEIGAAQGRKAQQLARERFPDASISLLTDLAGRDRVLRIEAQ